MTREKNPPEAPDKTYAAVCGLYCKACSWLIATTEDPQRLKKLAKQMHLSEEDARCLGCRSEKRLPYCGNCKMFRCAAEKGIDFCSACNDYPCEDLRQFQRAMPHRIALWNNLDRIRAVGYEQWLAEVRDTYVCPDCGTINSAYDLKCHRCGTSPSCAYVAQHKQAIETFIKRVSDNRSP